MIFPICFTCPRETESLYDEKGTFAAEEITHPQLAKNDLVVVLDFLAQQPLFAVDEFF